MEIYTRHQVARVYNRLRGQSNGEWYVMAVYEGNTHYGSPLTGYGINTFDSTKSQNPGFQVSSVAEPLPLTHNAVV